MMKKTGLVFMFMVMGLVVFGQNTSGVIQELSGLVEIKDSGGDYVAAKAGDRVSQDTVISTGFKSTALVEVGSAVIAVRPLTRLTLTEIQASMGTETINVSLQAGRVRVDVNPPAGTKASLSVVSPVATASVRGTSFDFDTRNLAVSNGTVGFAGNRGKQMLVSAGSQSRVETTGKVADPIKEKARGLRPPAPVGADSSSASGAISEPAHLNGTIAVELIYPQS